MNTRQLCLELAYSESEREVIDILKRMDYWNNADKWRYYGDTENNFATIGNQQSRPEAAVVEKLINSVDAVLMAECLRRGTDPEGADAPASILEALHVYFNVYAGKLSNIPATIRSNLAEHICFVATGRKTNPCYAIIDNGEGQTAHTMPDTLLSIGRSNKLRIPFVQGKFNMGGTGVLQFCGSQNLQLIISKRHPEIAERELDWSFTIVRREYPKRSARSSFYRYLAPEGALLSFPAQSLPLLPGDYPNPYERPLYHGTFIKLYEYQMTGFYGPIYHGLYYRLSLLIPEIALPIRLYERRKGYAGNPHEKTLSGLSVRLEEERFQNIERGFPTTSILSLSGQHLKGSIYLFKPGKSESYIGNEGILFTVNGQTHAYLSKRFFGRKSVGMSYLADSLLIIIDCTELDLNSRENLFMNSRDRLRSGALRNRVEKTLEELIGNNQGLKEFRERRRRDEIENKLDDSRPLVDVIGSILRQSPSLSTLFIDGTRLPNPFKMVRSREDYNGSHFPTIFRLKKHFDRGHPKPCPVNLRCRIQYHTDAENDYFNRDNDPGRFTLRIAGRTTDEFSIDLWNGMATLTISLPPEAQPGDVLHFQSEVFDTSMIKPTIEEFYVSVEKRMNKTPGRRQGGGQGDSGSRERMTHRPDHIHLPNVIEVHRSDWERHAFDREGALRVLDTGEDGYDFFINMDNIHLLTEKKSTAGVDLRLLDARYKYGMVLVGIAMLRRHWEDHGQQLPEGEKSEEVRIYETIADVARAISPVLLPMIAGLAGLEAREQAPLFEEA